MEGSFQDFLREHLHRLFPDAKNDGAKNNVLINCPLCAKEGRPDTHRHMSICLGNDGKPLYYNCFKSSAHKGLLTPDSLQLLAPPGSVIDPGLLEAIESFNKHSAHLSRYKLNSNSRFNIDTVSIQQNEINEIKRQYICNRIGIDLSLQELAKNKIIFSIRDLMYKNYIKKFTRSEQIINVLDNYFIGFLTNNNGSIILRNMVYNKVKLPDTVNERYIKYLVVQGAPAGYYVIPTVCDIYKQTEIHIAEGTFDILSIFYNLRNANRTNTIYGSIGGNSYQNMIEYFLCEIGLVDPIIHIYIDNDIKPYVLPKIREVLKPLELTIYVHMNSYPNEKDFGVPKNKIQEYVYRLL